MRIFRFGPLADYPYLHERGVRTHVYDQVSNRKPTCASAYARSARLLLVSNIESSACVCVYVRVCTHVYAEVEGTKISLLLKREIALSLGLTRHVSNVGTYIHPEILNRVGGGTKHIYVLQVWAIPEQCQQASNRNMKRCC